MEDMRRGEIRYANLEQPLGRRPVLILTRSDLIPKLHSVMCAALTTNLRAIPSRLLLGESEGLGQLSEAVCDQILLVAKSDIETAPLGSIHPGRIPELDRALAYSLDIRKENLG